MPQFYKTSREFPPVAPPARLDDPDGYLPADGLSEAVNVALLLGKPLLVTGDPGTGKTQLAYSIAHELQLGPAPEPGETWKPFRFTAKHNSIARDLLYRYDSLQHFADANRAKIEGGSLKSAPEYIRYEALGEAIRLAHVHQQRSVVLIDEIDKAPREFPNDLLAELERMAFEVFESGEKFKAADAARPVVVITSNGEKPLPDAFLRRCVYFHIPFPDADRLREIVDKRLGGSGLRFSPAQLDALVAHFTEVRDLCRKKKPATSDLLSWLQVLDAYGFRAAGPGFRESLSPADADLLLISYSVLAKHVADLETLSAQLPAATRKSA
ncbi:MAG: MoxR family ATPase [Bacteroidia bacterium]|nr:MoxR family ATPase [Bacteroidia bacterium]